jgi:hypothetical protein
MNLIKNTTPYIGKLKLKFEKYPHYRGGGSGMLNKIHLNLGFTKLVSRMVPNQTIEGRKSNIDPVKIALIEKYTGGKVGKHEWWTVKGTNGNFNSNEKPTHEEDIIFHGVLENSFLTKDGKYVGDIETAWWYYKNQMRVCEEYPHGVGQIITKESYQTSNPIVEGYYGYTHRGGSSFKIGDRLFQEDYTPSEEDYPMWEWMGFESDFHKAYEKGDDLDKKWMDESGVGHVIPFKLRGPKVITRFDECREAAINMSKYLS